MRLAFPVVLLAACGGSSLAYAPLNAPPHAMTVRTPESVEVFEDKTPERVFVEVGSIKATAHSDVSVQSLTREMRDDAAQRGCDALIAMHWTPETSTLQGTCILYRDSGPGPAPKPLTEAPMHGY